MMGEAWESESLWIFRGATLRGRPGPARLLSAVSSLLLLIPGWSAWGREMTSRTLEHHSFIPSFILSQVFVPSRGSQVGTGEGRQNHTHCRCKAQKAWGRGRRPEAKS